jgi:hypothetical protein
MLIALFNGPPGCGKDFLTNRMHDGIPNLFARFKMSKILKELTHAHYGMPGKSWDAYEGTIKDQPLAEFHGLTPRQAYIHFSEDILKPRDGEEALGRYLALELEQARSADPNIIATISDSGFSAEAQPLIERFGPDAIMLFRIHMEGRTFANDSRSYIELDGIETHDIVNEIGCADAALETVYAALAHRLSSIPSLMPGQAAPLSSQAFMRRCG